MFNVRSILVPIDFSHNSDAALNVAVDVARKEGAMLHLLHVLAVPVMTAPTILPLQSYPSGEVLAQARMSLDKLGLQLGVPCQTAVEEGAAADHILGYAHRHDVDLIVMSTHGRTGLARFLLGSTTEHVLRRAPCPMLTISPGALEPDQPLIDEKPTYIASRDI